MSSTVDCFAGPSVESSARVALYSLESDANCPGSASTSFAACSALSAAKASARCPDASASYGELVTPFTAVRYSCHIVRKYYKNHPFCSSSNRITQPKQSFTAVWASATSVSALWLLLSTRRRCFAFY